MGFLDPFGTDDLIEDMVSSVHKQYSIDEQVIAHKNMRIKNLEKQLKLARKQIRQLKKENKRLQGENDSHIVKNNSLHKRLMKVKHV